MSSVNIGFIVNSRYKWTLSVALSLFFFVFMLTFLPFGITNYDPNFQFSLEFLLTLLLFTTVTFITCSLNEFYLKKRIVKRVNLRGYIVWSVWLIVLVGFANYLIYNYLGNWHDFSFKGGIQFITNVSAVLLFPIVGVFFYFRYQDLKIQFEEVLINTDSMGQENSLISFQGEGVNDQVQVQLKDFLYAQAQDNYVEIVYVAEKSVQKHLLRTTIKGLIDQLKHPMLIRCHRSFMVNIFNVRSTIGHSQIRLNIHHIQHAIPVSRTYQQEVIQALDTFKSNS